MTTQYNEGSAYSTCIWCAKDEMKRRAEIERDNRINGGFLYNGHYFGSTLKDRVDVIGLATAANSGIPFPSNFTWRTLNGVNVALNTPALVIGLGAALLVHVNTCYNVGWWHKYTIDNYQNVEEVWAHDINKFWPAMAINNVLPVVTDDMSEAEVEHIQSHRMTNPFYNDTLNQIVK